MGIQYEAFTGENMKFNVLKQLATGLVLVFLVSLAMASAIRAQQSQPPGPRVVDLKSSDGTLLKATYFSAGRPGPGVILFHQNNRTRTSWDDVARQLAASGINTLTVDSRGHGESGGTREYASQKWQADADAAFQFLISQPGVQRDVIGVG